MTRQQDVAARWGHDREPRACTPCRSTRSDKHGKNSRRSLRRARDAAEQLARFEIDLAWGRRGHAAVVVVDLGDVVAGVFRRIAVDRIVVKNGENFCHVCHSLCCDKACRRAAPDRAPSERQYPAAVSLFIRGSRSPERRSTSSFAFPLSAIGGRCFSRLWLSL